MEKTNRRKRYKVHRRTCLREKAFSPKNGIMTNIERRKGRLRKKEKEEGNKRVCISQIHKGQLLQISVMNAGGGFGWKGRSGGGRKKTD